MAAFLSTSEIAELLGQPDWRIRRLFEDGSVPEPDRFLGKRIVPASLIPAISQALIDRGWLEVTSEVTGG